METILVAVVVGLCVLVASSMIYLLVWNLFRVYFTKYMDRYFMYNKETQLFCAEMLEKTLVTLETIYKLENNIPVKEKKNED